MGTGRAGGVIGTEVTDVPTCIAPDKQWQNSGSTLSEGFSKMPNDQLERSRLAIETKLKRADQAIAKKQLALAEAQFEWQKEQAAHSGWEKLLTPTGVVLVAAALGLVGTAAGKWADYLTTKRQQQTTIILKASEVPPGIPRDEQDQQRARNLLWFAEARFIELPDRFTDQLRTASKLKAGEKLPSPVVSIAEPQSARTAPSEKICLVIFNSDDRDPKNLTHLLFPGARTQDCARFGQNYLQFGATDVIVGCRQGGDVRVGQRFAITPGHGYDPNLSALGAPFGPNPNCGWD